MGGKKPDPSGGVCDVEAELDSSAYGRRRHTGAASGPETDYARLMDDLVMEQSRVWMMNRYQAGSITGVQVDKGGDGRARTVQASYAFSSVGKAARGSVRLTLEDGLPKCLYFSDFPETCRTANKRISAAYEDGEYAR